MQNVLVLPILARSDDLPAPDTVSPVAVKALDGFEPYNVSQKISEQAEVAAGGNVSLALRPRTTGESWIGEHADLLGPVLAAAGLGNVVSGQVFRASAGVGNVDRIAFRAKVGGLHLLKEDFDYANDAALQAVWVASDAVNTQCTRWTVDPPDGNPAMQVAVTGAASNGDVVTDTLGAAEDWTDYGGIEFYFRTSGGLTASTVAVRIRIHEGANVAYWDIPVGDGWQRYRPRFLDFANSGTVNWALVDKIEVMVVSATGTGAVVFDDIELWAEPGAATVGLWNVAGPTPAALGALVASVSVSLRDLDDSVVGVDFGGAVVVAGNYYAVGLMTVTSPVATLQLRGDNGTGHYNNGSRWETADGGTNVTSDNTETCWFAVQSRTAGVVSGMETTFFRSDAEGAAAFARLVMIMAHLVDGGTGTIEKGLWSAVFDTGAEQVGLQPVLPNLLADVGDYVEVLVQDEVSSTGDDGIVRDPFFVVVDLHYRTAPVAVWG